MTRVQVTRVGLAALAVALAATVPAGAQQEIPEVDSSTIWVGAVQRGELVRQVRGPGTLERFGRGYHAHMRVAEFQAAEIELGQPAIIDTRSETVRGEVAHIEDRVEQGTVAVVVAVIDPLGDSARPGLSIDGRIEVERLGDTVYVERPAYAIANETVGVFRIAADGRTAARVPVRWGASSVDKIVVAEGLEVGDRIILSDMSRYDSAERVRIVN